MEKRCSLWGPLLVLASAGCGGERHCAADSLAMALQAAGAGETVEVGDCAVAGAFVVPAGVTLAGGGAQSILRSSGSEPVVRMETAEATSRLADLRIESSGAFGVQIDGPGAAEIAGVTVEPSLGVGIGAQDLASLSLANVTLQGPVDLTNAPMFIDAVITSTETATFGLVVARTNAVTMSQVTARGFASAGVLLHESSTTWSNGAASENLGIGLFVEGGTCAFTDVELCGNFQGLRLLPAFGGAFTGRADVTSMRARVCETEGVGLFHATGTAQHDALDASDNGETAVWAQQLDELEVTGAIADNGFAGLVAVDVARVTVRDAEITGTLEVTRPFDTFGMRQVGDGLHLVRSVGTASIEDVTLTGNARNGILIELAGQPIGGLSFSNVAVTVTSTTIGAVVAQGGPTPAGWDNGVVRMGTNAQNDAMLVGQSVVDGVGPCDRPRESGLAGGDLSTLVAGF